MLLNTSFTIERRTHHHYNNTRVVIEKSNTNLNSSLLNIKQVINPVSTEL